MSNLRLCGLALGLGGLVAVFLFYRGPRWRRSNFLVLVLLNAGLAAVSADPNLVNVLSDLLALKQAQRGRLIALLIASTLLLWLALLYLKGVLDRHRLQFDRMVRFLGRQVSPGVEEGLRGREVAVLLPAFNEAANLAVLLPALPREVAGRKLAVLVVDDGSEDGTAAAAAAAGALVARSPVNRGGGAALRLGYDLLRAAGVAYVVTMDADGQHRPEDLPGLVAPLLAGECDLVVGSRILGAREADSRLRFAGVHLFSFLVRRLLGLKLTDVSSGFRAFRVEAVAGLNLREDQYHTCELLFEAGKRGLRIAEAPVVIRRRFSGQSKKGRNLRYALHFARVILRAWWR